MVLIDRDSDNNLDETDGAVIPAPSETNPFSFLRFREKLAYSVGHVLNDLCASMWFTYLLLYLHNVKQFGPLLAGELLLVGQIVDAVATPFVGLESDREPVFGFCGRYGKRKSWHLVGTVAVLVSFPFIFVKCTWCYGAHDWTQFFYYAVLITIFQIGWAFTQISHLSLIPDLTLLANERTSLNALRYAFTVGSNIFVYSVTLLVINANAHKSNPDSQIGSADAELFQLVVLIVVGVGAVFTLIFHVFVSDPTRVSKENDASSGASGLTVNRSLHLQWNEWFKESQFYIVQTVCLKFQTGLLYMATRLYVNMSQVFIGLYLQKTLQLPKSSIAIIPLVMYTSGFLASFPINLMVKKLKLRTIYAMGVGCAVIASGWIATGSEFDTYTTYGIYAVSALIGIASTILLITSLAITNELIGASTASGAFVYGAMSFLDKLSNGVIVLIIQSLPEFNSSLRIPIRFYYHYVMVYACGGSAVLGLCALLMLSNSKHSERRTGLMNRTPTNRSEAGLNKYLVGEEASEDSRAVET